MALRQIQEGSATTVQLRAVLINVTACVMGTTSHVRRVMVMLHAQIVYYGKETVQAVQTGILFGTITPKHVKV